MNKITYLSVFFFCLLFTEGSTLKANNLSIAEYNNQMQRVRLDFTMPNGYVRHLLLGFTPDNAATEGVDYGYDTATYDSYPDDLNWMIEDERYVIQGVGEFNEANQYPLGMFLTNNGTIEISLTSLENFETAINVYLYDSVLDTHTLINDSSYSGDFASGEYLDRFFIVFINSDNNENSDDETILSVNDQTKPITEIKYLRNTSEVIISSNYLVNKIEIYNLLGKKIAAKENIRSKEIKIRLNHINSPYGLVRVYTQNGIVTKKIILQ